jgi:cytochrome c oxidase assembly protein subunit 15
MNSATLAIHPRAEAAHVRAIGTWLLLCCAVLLALVMLGGATRLTESGLSIVDWKPVTGVLPPIGEAAWQAEFARYQQSPQYQTVNHGMSLADFKTIFWYEYGHRLLARALGLVYALPLLWFWWRGMIPRTLRWPLLGVLALGAAQGYMGWFMVKSGLVDIPRVSPYRLAAHLMLALAIYASMFWLALQTLWPRARAAVSSGRLAKLLLAMVLLTILYGAFVAGLRAGLYYNTFPLMGGRWIPEQMAAYAPLWTNLTENPVAVQFIHRWLALATAGLALAVWWRQGALALDSSQRLARQLLLAAVALQLTLGIATLLAKVPVWLGTLHQGGAVVLLSAVLLWIQRGRPQRA